MTKYFLFLNFTFFFLGSGFGVGGAGGGASSSTVMRKSWLVKATVEQVSTGSLDSPVSHSWFQFYLFTTKLQQIASQGTFKSKLIQFISRNVGQN